MIGSTYINFDTALNKGMKLIITGKDKNFGLLIVVGINLGLRISDLLNLTFSDLREDNLELTEGKSKKTKKLKINQNIKKALENFKEVPGGFNCFISQKKSVYSVQTINRKMKQYFKGKRVSSHSLRKTFGRKVWDNHGQSEKALIYLSELFNHRSISVTRKYLGIRQEELDDIYLGL